MKTRVLGKLSELSLADKAIKQPRFLQLNNRACLVSCSSSIYIPNSQMDNFRAIWMPSNWEQRESQQGGGHKMGSWDSSHEAHPNLWMIKMAISQTLKVYS